MVIDPDNALKSTPFSAVPETSYDTLRGAAVLPVLVMVTVPLSGPASEALASLAAIERVGRSLIETVAIDGVSMV
jgi:hypothetical protein